MTTLQQRFGMLAMSFFPHDLREVLHYDPYSGQLFWRERSRERFTGPRAETMWKAWNKRHAGKHALTTKHSHGYLTGRVFDRFIYAHRAAWAIFSCEWPTMEIDHINGDPSDNRIENLRHVSHATNLRNCKLSKNNSTGFMGVWLDMRSNTYAAEFSVGGHRTRLYGFGSAAEASVALKTKRAAYDFGPNHGE
jgi:hypothetical protein